MKIQGFSIEPLISKLSFIVILFISFSLPLFATNWYVYKNASGSNNGTNWTNAWKSFSVINWSLINPGDKIYISGGTDSTVYNETLEPACSGTASNYVTIIAGKYSPSPSGHSGRVIIDGGNTRYGIAFFDQGGNKPSYVIVKGLETNNVEIGVYANFDTGHNCLVLDSLGLYGFRNGGVRFETGETGYQNADSLFIQNCKIVSPDYIDGESDGIQLKGVSHVFIDRNYIRIPNQQPTAHVDALQGYLVNGGIITNNVFINDSVYSPEGGGIPIIYGAEGTLPVIMYNNFCYMGGVWYSGGNWAGTLMTRWYDHNPMPPTYIINNTVVSNGPRVRGVWLEFATPTNTVVVNNIIAQFSTTSSGVISTFDNSTGSALRVDNLRHNLFYRSWSNDVTFAGNVTGNGRTGTPTGWNDWINNYGGTGVKGNPLLVSDIGHEPDQGLLNGELKSGSPAINQGEDIESLLNYLNTTYGLNGRLQRTDINGNPRDNTPTIGAYEYIEGGGGTNNPPSQPGNPNPTNGATGQVVNSTISWSCTDPDGNPLTYDVYFGTSSNPSLVASNRTSANYTPGQLNNNRTYYWKIVVKDNQGGTTTGPVWNFTTENAVINNPPSQPGNPNPTNGATGHSVNSTLSWSCTDPDGNPLTYDVYFGTSDNPSLVASNRTSANYTPGQLNNNTTYYWKILAKDNQGGTTTGSIWSFTTINPDVTPPELVNATLIDPLTLFLQFSESLQPASATNGLNYSINNGVSVNEVSLSQDGKSVSVSTTQHAPGTNYLVQVNNVTDLSENIIDPSNNSAAYSYNSGDTTPPQLLSATLLDTDNLELIFSEGLDIGSAQVVSNYTISNDIIINCAQLSINLYKVILNTSQHTSGQTYSITVQNLKDLSGNSISQIHNSADYNYVNDNIPPDILNLTSTNTKNIIVNFSEKLDPVKAKNKNNYSISSNILINSAQLLPDSMGVSLKTSTQQREVDYILTLTDITDKSGNNISPNPKSVSYRISKRGKGVSTQTLLSKAVSNSWEGNYLPEKTIDGDGMENVDSRWMSGKIMPDTISYDIGKNSSLDSLRISFYKWESGRQYKYSVYGSKDSLNWKPIVCNIWSESLEWTTIEFDSTEARFVKLILLESNQSPWASIWEIEMFGPTLLNNDGDNSEVLSSFSLLQNYPNPFNPSTTIRYVISDKSRVSIKVFDLLGSEVAELVDSEMEAGDYRVEFKASGLTSGIYFYRLQTDSFIETKKMILLK